MSELDFCQDWSCQQQQRCSARAACTKRIFGMAIYHSSFAVS